MQRQLVDQRRNIPKYAARQESTLADVVTSTLRQMSAFHHHDMMAPVKSWSTILPPAADRRSSQKG